MSNITRESAHFSPSFYSHVEYTLLHSPSRPIPEIKDPLFHLAIENGKLGKLACQTPPADSESDLRKVCAFVQEHLPELATVTLGDGTQILPFDTATARTLAHLAPVDFLIEKHNTRVENSVWVRIVSIFLAIITLGIYNYKNSLLISPLITPPGNIKVAPLAEVLDRFLAEKEVPKEIRMAEQQCLINSFLGNDPGSRVALMGRYPGLSSKISAAIEVYPTSSTIKTVTAIAEDYGLVAFYRSGPTASLSMFADCPNGISIYDKKFSSIASALEYKRCEIAGCSQDELDKFTSLDGEAAIAYGEQLTDDASKKQALADWDTNAPGIMYPIIEAKYSQNPDMLWILGATSPSALLFHAPDGSKEAYWSDGGDGKGANVFAQLLEQFRATTCFSHFGTVLGSAPQLSEESKAVMETGNTLGRISIYSTGPTASLSMFADCPKGITIYGKKFSCIASALAYKECQAAGFAQDQCDRLVPLNGKDAIALSKQLQEQRSPQGKFVLLPLNPWPRIAQGVMQEIIQAKYAQNPEMLEVLGVTNPYPLVFHMSQVTEEKDWSDGGDGLGKNLFGDLLAAFRASVNWGAYFSKPASVVERMSYFNKHPTYKVF